MNEALEWSAFAVGTVGTVFWATGWTVRGKKVEGWFWLLSALLWIWFALSDGKYGLAARDVLGAMLYIFGIMKAFKADESQDTAKKIAEIAGPIKGCDICGGSGVHYLAGPGASICVCKAARNDGPSWPRGH